MEGGLRARQTFPRFLPRSLGEGRSDRFPSFVLILLKIVFYTMQYELEDEDLPLLCLRSVDLEEEEEGLEQVQAGRRAAVEVVSEQRGE